jgi:hypothetical protein
MSAKVSQGSQSFFLFYFSNHIGYKFYFVNRDASLEIKSIMKTIYKTFAFSLGSLLSMNRNAITVGICPDRLSVAIHAPEQGRQRHIRQGLTFSTGEYHIVVTILRH